MTRALRFAVLLTAVLVLLAESASAVGSNTVTVLDVGGGVTRYKLTWLSDASGNVSANTFSVKAGELLQVKFVPNGGGTAPADLYDIVLNDTDTVDVLAGGGANLSATVSTVKVPSFGTTTLYRYVHDGQQVLDLNVSNAGNAKGGIVYLWVR